MEGLRISGFRPFLPPVEKAHLVAAPPYDVLTRSQALSLARNNPHSILHVTRPDIHFSEESNPYSPDVYEDALRHLQSFIQSGTLCAEPHPSLYLYQISSASHHQTGLVCLSHVNDYDTGKIKEHELTRPDKEQDRVNLIQTLRAQTGPVFLTYPDNPPIDSLTEEIQKGEPYCSFVEENGIRHSLWRITGTQPFVEAFASIPVSYIADGHHRAAAASRVAQKIEGADYFLSILFPASQLRILPYNRLITGLNGLNSEEFLQKVREKFEVQQVDLLKPEAPGQIHMYFQGKCYSLKPLFPIPDHPINSLDVSVLQENILCPVLGIQDPRTSSNIQFVGGPESEEVLKGEVDAGRGMVAFLLYPVSIRQLFAVADAGLCLPPKSTWFHPKPLSGLFIYAFG